ncbi:hypothetical protein IEQ34_016034 [Dendrobium chrysotoxum]|uniref:RsdA/BaiN/AoA(So)-like Rossmann fold-like domain-containing protein n=1 Tax=Dendrobium chrysotoxum TaxID=161865 RepID=A0AAV7FWI9_DENCH|nr:hypothetical protein IEQ34_016034 [Dendrobium chrysotoxum]
MKGQFKEEFVTSGGVPLSEITLSNMESRIRRNLFFAGEVLNVDGITGGFNFQYFEALGPKWYICHINYNSSFSFISFYQLPIKNKIKIYIYIYIYFF